VRLYHLVIRTQKLLNIRSCLSIRRVRKDESFGFLESGLSYGNCCQEIGTSLPLTHYYTWFLIKSPIKEQLNDHFFFFWGGGFWLGSRWASWLSWYKYTSKRLGIYGVYVNSSIAKVKKCGEFFHSMWIVVLRWYDCVTKGLESV
jgi:hypothetical protein